MIATRPFEHSPARLRGGAALKLVSWIAALLLVAAPIVGVMKGWFASDTWPFRQLRVDAQFDRINVDQIRGAAMPHLGVGFFAVDLAAVRRSVEQVPWVERAEVRKQWPDRLEIRVIERHAVAVWDDRALLSERGEIFEVPGETVPAGLPRLIGPNERAIEVLSFFREVTRMTSGHAFKPVAMALSGRGSWAVELDNGARVIIGREAPRERLERFLDALGDAASTPGAVLVRADLRYANGFALQWRAAPEPTSPVETPSPVDVAPPADAPVPVQPQTQA